MRFGNGWIGGARRWEWAAEPNNYTFNTATSVTDAAASSFYMRLVKEGSNYTSQYSLDGNTYQQVADPINYNFGSPAYLGFVALQGSTHYETAAPVTIDYFSVDPLTATANAYDFTFTYNSGDSYRGAVIATPAYGYSETYTQAINTETGPGAYIINRVIPGYDPALAGQVLVDSYFDAQSNRLLSPVNAGMSVGSNYLGSESDYIFAADVPEFMFGNDAANSTFREADAWFYNSDTGNYYTLTSIPGAWTASQAAAAAYGGNLVTINNQAENDWLLSTFGGNEYWIGLYQTDKQDEPAGHWAWVNGEPLTYTNWAGGEPLNWSGNEEVAFMNWDAGLWNDAGVDYPAYGIIELSAAAPADSGLFDFTFNYGSGDTYTARSMPRWIMATTWAPP